MLVDLFSVLGYYYGAILCLVLCVFIVAFVGLFVVVVLFEGSFTWCLFLR